MPLSLSISLLWPYQTIDASAKRAPVNRWQSYGLSQFHLLSLPLPLSFFSFIAFGRIFIELGRDRTSLPVRGQVKKFCLWREHKSHQSNRYSFWHTSPSSSSSSSSSPNDITICISCSSSKSKGLWSIIGQKGNPNGGLKRGVSPREGGGKSNFSLCCSFAPMETPSQNSAGPLLLLLPLSSRANIIDNDQW